MAGYVASPKSSNRETPRILVTIKSVNIADRFCSGLDRYGVIHEIFIDRQGPIISIPKQGERWYALQKMGRWTLEMPYVESVFDGKQEGDVVMQGSGKLYFSDKEVSVVEEAVAEAIQYTDTEITTVNGKITVSTLDPTPSDAIGKPSNAIWEVRDNTTAVRRYILNEAGDWVQVKIGEGYIAANSVTTNELAANAIDGMTIRGAKFISPSDLGEIEIFNNLLRVKRQVGDGEFQTTTSIGGQSEGRADTFELYPTPIEQEGIVIQPPAGVMLSGEGEGSFIDLSTDSLRVENIDFLEYVQRAPKGVMNHTWASGNAIPSWGYSAMGLVRFSWRNNPYRRYKICCQLHLQGQERDSYRLSLHHTSGSNMPTISNGSPAPGGVAYGDIGANSSVGGSKYTTVYHEFPIYYQHDLDYNVLIAIRTWNANREMRLMPGVQSNFWLEDMGHVGEASSAFDTGGGSQFSGTPPPAPTPQPVTRTGVWKASYVRTWRGSSISSGDLQHGTYGGVKRTSQIVFSAIGSTLNGATINWARIKLKNVHTHNSTGAVINLSTTYDDSLRATPFSQGPNSVQRTIKQYDNNYYSLSSVFWTETRSVWLGLSAGTGLNAYAHFSPLAKDCVLEVNYTK